MEPKYKVGDILQFNYNDGTVSSLRVDFIEYDSNDGDYGYVSNWIADINYVHELQHALKLQKIEKEIIL